jgi:hypothetical protein
MTEDLSGVTMRRLWDQRIELLRENQELREALAREQRMNGILLDELRRLQGEDQLSAWIDQQFPHLRRAVVQ